MINILLLNMYFINLYIIKTYLIIKYIIKYYIKMKEYIIHGTSDENLEDILKSGYIEANIDKKNKVF